MFYDRYRDDRTAVGRAVAEERGLALVPSYDDPLVMAGQGTAALELLQQAGDRLDLFVAPMSGGDLMAGCATAVRTLSPTTRIVGVEPEVMADTKRSLAAGVRIRVAVVTTIADGLQTDVPGELTFPINRAHVDDVVLVSDDELVTVMTLLFDCLKVVVEPSGAAALAAVLAGWIDARGKRVGVVLSGGNVGHQRLAQLVTERATAGTSFGPARGAMSEFGLASGTVRAGDADESRE